MSSDTAGLGTLMHMHNIVHDPVKVTDQDVHMVPRSMDAW